MKLFTLFTLFFITSTASAGINLDMRADHLTEQKYKDTSDSDVDAKGYFKMSRARMKFSGKLNDSLSAQARLNFLETTTSKSSAGNTSKYIDFAELTHKIDDSLSFSFGKLADNGVFGFEGLTSTGDQYVTSAAYGVFGGYPYFTGAKASYTMGDNKLNAYMFNGASDDDKAQGRTGLGVDYRMVINESLKMMANYHIVPTQKDNSALSASAQELDSNTILLGFGAEYKMDAHTFQFDYLADTLKEQSANALAGAADKKDKTITSMVLNWKWKMSQWSPVAKVSLDTTKDTKVGGTEITDNKTQMALGAEYVPADDASFRYHIVYSQVSNKYDSGNAYTNDKTTQGVITAGIRLNADLLK